MRLAKVIRVEPWQREISTYHVYYEFKGVVFKGGCEAKDELDAWNKFQARLDYEGSRLNGY